MQELKQFKRFNLCHQEGNNFFLENRRLTKPSKIHLYKLKDDVTLNYDIPRLSLVISAGEKVVAEIKDVKFLNEFSVLGHINNLESKGFNITLKKVSMRVKTSLSKNKGVYKLNWVLEVSYFDKYRRYNLSEFGVTCLRSLINSIVKEDNVVYTGYSFKSNNVYGEMFFDALANSWSVSGSFSRTDLKVSAVNY